MYRILVQIWQLYLTVKNSCYNGTFINKQGPLLIHCRPTMLSTAYYTRILRLKLRTFRLENVYCMHRYKIPKLSGLNIMRKKLLKMISLQILFSKYIFLAIQEHHLPNYYQLLWKPSHFNFEVKLNSDQFIFLLSSNCIHSLPGTYHYKAFSFKWLLA